MKRIVKNDEKHIDLRYLCLTSEILEGKSKSFSISDEKGLKETIALFNIKGKYYAISDTCAHKGGPLSQGILKEDVITCPWHGWKYNVRTGKSPHKGGDSVNSFVTKVISNKLYIAPIPSRLGKKVYIPHKKYTNLQNSVRNRLTHIDRASSMPVDRNVRVLGISTTNTNDDVAPRKSTSEEALNLALDYAKNKLRAECIMIKLRQLNFKHCEGYYSKNAKACIFPCSISEMDKEDQMLEIYEKVILWSDVVIVSTPIRWGNASSLYYQMVQRMNCVQNQSVTNNQYLIRDKSAAFIITGGQDNIQHVAGEMLSFWSELGFVFGKFPFVGWSRGWYAEDTENNYDQMMTANESAMKRDIMRSVLGAVEMSRLLRKYKYDEHVLTV
jgi:nitrite reductase/ring-hydroxylating ferredoxin subunit/multimeric flavodoxin WrbA